jgi:hypothetical protein
VSEAAAVVFDLEGKGLGLEMKADVDFGGGGVADDVGDGFLEGEEEIVAYFGGER